jgi:hypothetical protein
MDQIPKIGVEYDEDIDRYELILDDHISTLNPSEYGAEGPIIDPKDYFITSGDAVEKSKALCKRVHDIVRETADSPNASYKQAVTLFLSQCEGLRDNLIKARGKNIFLETEWDLHRLYCIPKNPRARE